MQSIISRVSTNNLIFFNTLQIIEMHNKRHALPKITYPNDLYARTNWQCFTKIITITDMTVGTTSDLKLFGGGVREVAKINYAICHWILVTDYISVTFWIGQLDLNPMSRQFNQYSVHGWHGGMWENDRYGRVVRVQWPLLLTWINFNPSMDK